ncbi:MAG TPA: hypothetical protein VHG34_05090 [Nitrososphaeraceae archaeon]|jgi:hypothetical protein|nr:hypothetical protein [Nitrososphaeraceae archaeon]
MLKGIVQNSRARYTVPSSNSIGKEKGKCLVVKSQEDQSKEIVFHLYGTS